MKKMKEICTLYYDESDHAAQNRCAESRFFNRADPAHHLLNKENLLCRRLLLKLYLMSFILPLP